MVEVKNGRNLHFFGISNEISGTKDECFHFTQRISLFSTLRSSKASPAEEAILFKE